MDQFSSFPWPVLRSIIGGASAIDVPRLAVASIEEAEAFIECYGFCWQEPEHRAEIEKLRRDALAFIDEELINDISIDIDPRVSSEDDLRKVLLWASQESGSIQLWSCALLRVMHTFAHCQSYFSDRYGDEIRRQIFERIEPHLKMTDEGLELGESPGIPLLEFEAKPMKERRSIAMKLMHKAENVAADIFDRVGIRFVTRERFDALLVVKYLREHNVVMFANVKPSRSRNTLIDVDLLHQTITELDLAVADRELTPDEQLEHLRREVRNRAFPSAPSPANEYSSISYHSIQFTCRQMIRIPDEALGGIRFFFPFEIQIMDEASYQQTREGLASHELYKARQREAVQRRILGALLG